MPTDFRFDARSNLAVYVCEHVGRGLQPILHVLAGDPTLNDVAKMCTQHHATRPARDAAWQIVDEMEEHVRDNIRKHGWHVMRIPDDEEGAGFAYSIGLDPELIAVGLKTEVMHSMINTLGERMRAGHRLAPNDRVEGLLVGATCVLVEVDRVHYNDHLGYALWYHGGADFRTLQIVWPSKTTAKFPWDEGADSLREWQSVLGRPGAS